jgi:holo-[acyl-carrier protein] synthase
MSDSKNKTVPAVGIDIIEISRIKETVKRWGTRFLERIYTKGELEYCRSRPPQLAARFASKEAMMKALGTGRYGVNWKDIEVVRPRGRAPNIILHGRANEVARRLGIKHIAVSISHSREYAVATVHVEIESHI